MWNWDGGLGFEKAEMLGDDDDGDGFLYGSEARSSNLHRTRRIKLNKCSHGFVMV